jgi:uncharacterized protein (TIGR00297 family)
MNRFSETRRQTVHMLMALFALLLRYLDWRAAAACAIAAFLFNLLVLPRLGGTVLYRPDDRARGYPLGILFYPLSILTLILAFPRRPDIVAAAWGILAVGDGAATLVGRRIGGRRLPWNPSKTVAGSVTLAVAGGAAGVLLAAWTRPAVSPEPPLLFVLAAPFVAAVAAAFVESLRVGLDDNISVPLAAAIVLGALGLIDGGSARAGAASLAPAMLLALAVNVPVAGLGWALHSVSRSGAIAGAVIGVLVMAFAGPPGWTLLFASFVLATASTRLGLKRKVVLGIAEERGGRRGPGNAIANTGLAALAAIVAAFSTYRDGALLVMVTALAAGASDTVASEVGKAWGQRTYLVPSLRPVRPGTPGAVSLEGTAAGVVSALGLAGLGTALALIEGNDLWFATAGATFGAFVESGLGATLEARGVLDNDMLNFINTGAAAAAAVALAWLFR